MRVLHLITSLIIYGMGVRGHVGVYTPCLDKDGDFAQYVSRIEFFYDGTVALTHQEGRLGRKKVYVCKYYIFPINETCPYYRARFEGYECWKLLQDSKGYLMPDSFKCSLQLPKFEYLLMPLPSPHARTALYKDRSWKCSKKV
ncbi:hypothetical protein Pmar_PMAR001073 [Perkinsus marinus ATCC 50983]|uniref:Uncharacterized protein n=1 Tax=Perkinsus marinus (strain ATCC 50983 / TXsc) TaxID=423536 RepID=C5KTH1_PERM5|nr:hypothetical protein Pmar_PMAR001073 [Perkinsus marinus ATCC 50983]EER12276.1 hypothetical protein Pmar_PMAR001073 [Perkinsus marinus ATCC 50983]|eukprot:XP_002780481.1 hypothetical protein Pmar_PMAR001073 [Perkinsus marinus ATCC 50983]